MFLSQTCHLYVHMGFSLNVSLCVKLSSCKKISHIGLGPVLMISSH